MPESTTNPLDYYAQHSIITDPREHGDLFAGLPTGVAGLVRVVQGLLIHPAEGELYDVRFTSTQIEEERLRSVAQILARIRELDPAPLTIPREPVHRLVGVCRDFATMLCAMLRHQGVPARARCGFAKYFHGPNSTPGFSVDHWVCECWKADEQRWVLVDAEVGENEREYYHVEIDTLDVPRNQFLVAGRAWQLCRSGEADPDGFGLGPDSMRGTWYVQSQLVRDLAAMNKMELLCWDCWALGDRGPDDGVSADEMALLDRVAVLTQAGNETFTELRSIYEDDRWRVPPVITSYTEAGSRTVDLVNEQVDLPHSFAAATSSLKGRRRRWRRRRGVIRGSSWGECSELQ
jgi:hypothetical protein